LTQRIGLSHYPDEALKEGRQLRNKVEALDRANSDWLLMDRICLTIMSASIVLLTTAFGLASPRADGALPTAQVPLLLRTIPR
jgi:hypothetical protein